MLNLLNLWSASRLNVPTSTINVWKMPTVRANSGMEPKTVERRLTIHVGPNMCYLMCQPRMSVSVLCKPAALPMQVNLTF